MAGRPQNRRPQVDSAWSQLDKEIPIPECFLEDSSVQLDTVQAAQSLQLSHSKNQDTLMTFMSELSCSDSCLKKNFLMVSKKIFFTANIGTRYWSDIRNKQILA